MVVRLPYMHFSLTTDALAGRRNGVDITKMLSTIASLMWFKDNRILSWDFYCSVSIGVDCFEGPIHALVVQNGRTDSLVEGRESI